MEGEPVPQEINEESVPAQEPAIGPTAELESNSERPTPENLVDLKNQISSLVSSIEKQRSEILRSDNDYDDAFTTQVSIELNQLESIIDDLPTQAQDWSPSDRDLSGKFTRLFAPNRLVTTFDVSQENLKTLRGIQDEVDEIRMSLRNYLETEFKFVKIDTVPGKTVFNPTFHESSPAHQMPIDDPQRNNIVYECVWPGFIMGNQVLKKALVKRYVQKAESTQKKWTPDDVRRFTQNP